MQWKWKKPEHYDHRDKAQLRWFHFSLIGRLHHSSSLWHAIETSPSTSPEAQKLAKQMEDLHFQLMTAMQERHNC